MNGTQNLNIEAKTLEQCLKTINEFGQTIYQNICTGEQSLVFWGSLDWAVMLLLIALLSAFVIYIVGVIIMVVFDL